MEVSRTIGINLGNCCLFQYHLMTYQLDFFGQLIRILNSQGDCHTSMMEGPRLHTVEILATIHCKMDGHKLFTNFGGFVGIQLRSLSHKSIACPKKYPKRWIAYVWKTLFHSVGEYFTQVAIGENENLPLIVPERYFSRRLMSKSKYL